MPAAAPVRAFVIVDGRQMALADGESIIGRAEHATVRLDPAGVSRCHARIVVAERGATLEDPGSKNGTYIGAEAVTAPRVLADGDEIIRVGTVMATCRISADSP